MSIPITPGSPMSISPMSTPPSTPTGGISPLASPKMADAAVSNSPKSPSTEHKGEHMLRLAAHLNPEKLSQLGIKSGFIDASGIVHKPKF